MGGDHSFFYFRCIRDSLLPSKHDVNNKSIFLYPKHSFITKLFPAYRIFVKDAFPMGAYPYLSIHFI